MKRSEFIDGLIQVLYDNQQFDGHDYDAVMQYIETHMLPKSRSITWEEVVGNANGSTGEFPSRVYMWDKE